MDWSKVEGFDDLLDGMMLETADLTIEGYDQHRLPYVPGVLLLAPAGTSRLYEGLRRQVEKWLSAGEHFVADCFVDMAIFLLASMHGVVGCDRLRVLFESLCFVPVEQILLTGVPFAEVVVRSEQLSLEVGSFRLEAFHPQMLHRIFHLVDERREKSLREKAGTLVIRRDARPIAMFDFASLPVLGPIESLYSIYAGFMSMVLWRVFPAKFMEEQSPYIALSVEVCDLVSLMERGDFDYCCVFDERHVQFAMAEPQQRRLAVGRELHKYFWDRAIFDGDMKIKELEALIRKASGQADSGFSLKSRMDSFWANGRLKTYAELASVAAQRVRAQQTDLSFMLLCTSLEFLLADKEGISNSLAARAAAILSLSADKPYQATYKRLVDLYRVRSRFVHEAEHVDHDVVEELQVFCQTVFRAALESWNQYEGAESKWQQEWRASLDYIAATLRIGYQVDGRIAQKAGFSTWVTGEESQ